jgi:hypothetical protein
MTPSQNPLEQTLATDARTAASIEPLLEDAAAALAETRVPTEKEIHDIVAGAYRFTENDSLESEDTDRRLEEAMKNVSKWREHAQVYLNGASVLLRRSHAALGRFEAKKKVLAAFRTRHPTPASERFYFTREAAVELPAELARTPRPALASPAVRGEAVFAHASFPALLAARPEAASDEQASMLVRLLAVPTDPRSRHVTELVEWLARAGERATPSVLDALSRPEEAARSVGGDTGELLIGVRRLLPRLPARLCERLLRAALEAGWLEWIDRPLLEPPLDAALRERLLVEFGTRQEPRGNPYRPTEPWFYNLDPD